MSSNTANGPIAGEIGIIPGSQGTPSYLVKGKGNRDSFSSCAHGAGRKMGRKQAQRQLDLAKEKKKLDDQGIIHITANGYGEGPYMGGPDTVNVYPMLYWNSNHQNWIAVTPESMESPDDGFGADLAIHRPGNGIGNSYGSISLSDDGQFVMLAWQGPEYTGEIGNSPINLFPGDGGANSRQIFYTDIYLIFSVDSGATWGSPQVLQGEPNIMECFPVLAPRLEIDGGLPTLHFLYLEDAIPGVSLFDENSWSDESVWRYQTWTPLPPSVEVQDVNIFNNFNLELNYPNPFNPSTKIKYQIADASFVNLQVYDVLGKEVATLINKEMQAGSYEVEFDASNLPSGIYYYTLNTGSYTKTKKMILLK